MKIRHTGQLEERLPLPMTPMIDIVFQLLIFFIFSLKIVLPEGDFNIRMPSAAAARAAEPSETLPWRLVIKATPTGELADLQFTGRSFGNSRDAFAQLQQHLRTLVKDMAGNSPAREQEVAANQEVEIECDYNLNYDYVIRAITAVTGYIEDGQRHKLIERIKFTPPQQ